MGQPPYNRSTHLDVSFSTTTTYCYYYYYKHYNYYTTTITNTIVARGGSRISINGL